MRLTQPPAESIRLGQTSQGPGGEAAADPMLFLAREVEGFNPAGPGLPATPPPIIRAGDGLLIALFEGGRLWASSGAAGKSAPAVPIATSAMTAAEHSHRSDLAGRVGVGRRVHFIIPEVPEY